MKTFIYFIVLLTSSRSIAQNINTHIIVGPNIQVSTDGNFSHGEYMLAANPKNPSNLIGVSTIFPLDNDNAKSVPYVSMDGGKSWNDISFSDQKEYCGDPEIAFSSTGVAYFCTYTYEIGNEKNIPILYFYSSTNGGKIWRRSLSENLVGKIESYDHPQLVVDQTKSKFAGNIYIGFLGGRNHNKFPNSEFPDQTVLGLLRSDDQGKSFIGPQIVVSGNEGMGMNATNLLVSSTGTLFFTYNEWYNDRSLPNSFNGSNACLILSKDGGRTFSSPKKIVKQNFSDELPAFYYVFPQCAIDNRSKRYRDRIYCVFCEALNGKAKIMFTYSKDEGETWSKPKLLDPNLPEDADQYQPAVAVNTKGEIGIRWFDTRGTKIGKGFNEYFTASLDGGETFLPPVRVSTKTSKIPDFRNEVAIPIWRRSVDKDSIFVAFKSAEGGRFPNGGDYIQFAADAKGIFHDFWADSRDGRAYQVYTSAIKVVEAGKNVNKRGYEFENKYKKRKKIDIKPKRKRPIQIAKDVFFNIDAADYDTITNILSVPVRIRNISTNSIYGPIKVVISKIDTNNKKNVPIIINSDNKEEAIGPTFNYILSDKYVLRPGEETATLTWKFRVRIDKKITKYTKEQMKEYRLDKNYSIKWFSDVISDLHINITGYLDE